MYTRREFLHLQNDHLNINCTVKCTRQVYKFGTPSLWYHILHGWSHQGNCICNSCKRSVPTRMELDPLTPMPMWFFPIDCTFEGSRSWRVQQSRRRIVWPWSWVAYQLASHHTAYTCLARRTARSRRSRCPVKCYIMWHSIWTKTKSSRSPSSRR